MELCWRKSERNHPCAGGRVSAGWLLSDKRSQGVEKQSLVIVEKLTSNLADSDGRFRVVQREVCLESCESGRLKEEEGRGVSRLSKCAGEATRNGQAPKSGESAAKQVEQASCTSLNLHLPHFPTILWNHRNHGDGSIIEGCGMALQASVLHWIHADEYSALQWLGRRANKLSSNEGHSLHPQQLYEVQRFNYRQTLAC